MMHGMAHPATRVLALLALAACTRPGEQRAIAELDVGSARCAAHVR